LSPTALDVAYTPPFVGTAAADFLEFLHRTDEDIQSDRFVAYAKTISVLQNSGMGKSRMLTEVGSGSDHTAWMSRYVAVEGSEDTMDVDP
jgi:hypothetical protein